ncbi:MAG TPA: HNH endonuclease signature motif containing protein [Pyrinomonadaceae bacterium]|nr:HNH endonuclease signature motif containing protein [Pyrinomonadaceae bacterium]
MTRYISDTLRQQVEDRASNICEYCLIPIEETYFGGEIDHIVGIKHKGETVLENPALSCHPCNRHKGSDLGSNSAITNILTRFYNPRIDIWTEHFQVNEDAEIVPHTEIGEVTVRIFKFNEFERVLERQGLIELGFWRVR